MNMRLSILLVVAALAALAMAAPPKPVWPKSFSTTIAAHNNERHDRPSFFRWFYSESLDAERVDGMVEYEGSQYFTEKIANFKTDIETAVFYGRDSVFCRNQNISRAGHTIPHPNFDHFEYVGEGDINFTPVNIWYAEDHHDHNSIVFMEAKHTGVPVRMDVHDRRTGPDHTVEFMFFEWDSAPQSSDMFKVNHEVAHLCNN